MQTVANWNELNFDEARAQLLAHLFPTRETVKSGSAASAGASGPGGSDTTRREAGGLGGAVKG
jgi:hypothetical protein